MYPSFALSDRQHPWRLKRQSGTPVLAAAEAPPALRLCKPYLFGSVTINLDPLKMALDTPQKRPGGVLIYQHVLDKFIPTPIKKAPVLTNESSLHLAV